MAESIGIASISSTKTYADIASEDYIVVDDGANGHKLDINEIKSKINEKLVISNNLSDLNSSATARSNLGLGSSATIDVGTTTDKIPQNGATLGNSQVVLTNASGKLITETKNTGHNKTLGTGAGNLLEIDSSLDTSSGCEYKPLVINTSGKVEQASLGFLIDISSETITSAPYTMSDENDFVRLDFDIYTSSTIPLTGNYTIRVEYAETAPADCSSGDTYRISNGGSLRIAKPSDTDENIYLDIKFTNLSNNTSTVFSSVFSITVFEAPVLTIEALTEQLLDSSEFRNLMASSVSSSDLMAQKIASAQRNEKEYAGNPTNNVTPDYRGQYCFDTSNDDYYISTGTTNADWKQITV